MSVCSPALIPTLSYEELVIIYFRLNLPYKDIIHFLGVVHGQHISLSTLKRTLRRLGLSRRKWTQHQLDDASNFIQIELSHSGSLLGYRSLWRRIAAQYHLSVPRRHVMNMLRIIAPTSTRQRASHRLVRRVYRSKGPNFIWHLDSYDKLKPFGFVINGCIDGYSRRIMWLKVGTSAASEVVAKYFIDCVKAVNGCPSVLRADLGTENAKVAYLQPFLRRHGQDSMVSNCFLYGKSTANQRIEAWWGILRRCMSEWWIDIFKVMRETGVYQGVSKVHRDCLKYCFLDLIQRELTRAAIEWNYHRIRRNRMAECPSGVPDLLYFAPHLAMHGVQDQKCAVDSLDLEVAERHAGSVPALSPEFINLVTIIMQEDGLSKPNNPREAFDLYMHLVDAIEGN